MGFDRDVGCPAVRDALRMRLILTRKAKVVDFQTLADVGSVQPFQCHHGKVVDLAAQMKTRDIFRNLLTNAKTAGKVMARPK